MRGVDLVTPRPRRRALGRAGPADPAGAAGGGARSANGSRRSSPWWAPSAYAHRAIGELSGGEQQRLLIATALVRRPRLLILDEPLDSLDLPNQAAVAGLIRRIASAEDVAVLLVAHDVNPLAAYLDRVDLPGGRPARCAARSTRSSPRRR